jgi:ethanolamine utilization protein EutQ (cupin superfamily)
MLHRKVIKQLIEQEAKFIRKPKRSVSKVDRLPYLKKFRKNFIESVKISDSEEEDIEVSIPQFVIPRDMKAIKIKNATPIPTKAKVYSHLRQRSKG